MAFYNIYGTDKYYKPKRGFGFTFNVSPFYQHTKGGRDKDGKQVPEGDMFGRWNMLGTMYGYEAAPTDKKFTFNDTDSVTEGMGKPTSDTQINYPYLSLARRVLDGLGATATVPNPFFDGDEKIKWEKVFGTTVDNDIKVTVGTEEAMLTRAYAYEADYDPSEINLGHYSVPIEYEKTGLRMRFAFDFGWGFGLSAKTGVVDIRQEPSFIDKTDSNTTAHAADKTLIKRYLMDELPRQYVFGDIPSVNTVDDKPITTHELDFKTDVYRETTFEDTHIDLHWCFPFDAKDDDGDVAVTFAPYLSFGVWAPSGNKQDIHQAFSIPSGNDGYVGYTLEGAFDMDFNQNFQLSLGGGAVFYGSKEYSEYRMPSSIYQAGIYPWMTKLRRKPGPVWYANLSLKAHEFIKNFSASLEYIYIQHNRDSITLLESNETRKTAFINGKGPETLQEYSRWKSNIIQGGIEYKVCPGLQLGLSFQAHISGVYVYRTTTVMGTMSLVF